MWDRKIGGRRCGAAWAMMLSRGDITRKRLDDCSVCVCVSGGALVCSEIARPFNGRENIVASIDIGTLYFCDIKR